MDSIISIIKKYKWPLVFAFVMVFAFGRLFFKIWIDTFSFLDEYITFDAAAGFMHTGEFKLWDFHTASLTDYEYTRAWPHSFLLSLWFRIFGVDVVAGKVLSCIFGLAAVLSWLYITYKIYDNPFVSTLSCLIFLTNTDVVTTFRMIRMYALWIPLMMWVFYFVYLAMIRRPKGAPLNGWLSKWQSFWDKLGFSPKYIILALVFLFFSYSTHVNSLAAGLGFILFFIYLLPVKREKRYFSALGLVILAVVLMYFVPLGIFSPFRGIIKEGLKFLTVMENPNTMYGDWVLGFIDNRRFFYFALAGFFIYLAEQLYCAHKAPSEYPGFRTKDSFDFSVFSFLTAASSLIAFIYFLNRYYQSRYIIYTAPLISLIMALGIYGWVMLAPGILSGLNRGFNKAYVMPAALLCAGLVCLIPLGKTTLNYYYDIYSSIEIPRHKNVYEIIRDDAKNELPYETIPIIGFDIRNNYAVNIFDSYVTREFDRKTDMEAFMDFAFEYPDGYMSVETSKINGFSEGIKPFIFQYSERITGDSIDTNAIETVRYHLLKKKGTAGELSGRLPGLISFEPSFGKDKTSVEISVDTRLLEHEESILFLMFDAAFLDGRRENRCCQLLVDDTPAKDPYYIYEFNIPHGLSSIELKEVWGYSS